MIINRPKYLVRLASSRLNGKMKLITGISQCGKTFFMFNIYKAWLNSIGIPNSDIIVIPLNEEEFSKYRNPYKLGRYIRERTIDTRRQFYVFIDGIEYITEARIPAKAGAASEKYGIVNVMEALRSIYNADFYVIGDDTKLLQDEVSPDYKEWTETISVHPLSYEEFYNSYSGPKQNAWHEYTTYGGLPLLQSLKDHAEKNIYLQGLIDRIYIPRVMRRDRVKNSEETMRELLGIIASSSGELTNPNLIADKLNEKRRKRFSNKTISDYKDSLENSFLISRLERFSISGKHFIGSPYKYYFSDCGLRNAAVNFSYQEDERIMENVIFNELQLRGYEVEAGVLEYNWKDKKGHSHRDNLGIDFIAIKDEKKIYIQTALSVESEKIREAEIAPLMRIKDSFKRIVVTADPGAPWTDANGIQYINIEEFLLKENLDK